MYLALLLMLSLQATATVAQNEDSNVYAAVLASVIRPEITQMPGDVARPAIVFETTWAVCKPQPTPPCFGNAVVEGIAATSPDTRRLFQLSASQRQALAASLMANNEERQRIATSELPGVIVARQDGFGARFSRPGYSSDGLAIVYASYTCGTLCGKRWLILLRRGTDGWQVVESELLGIS